MINPEKPKIILFDIDYTLIDTAKLRQLTHREIMSAANLTSDQLEIAVKKFSLVFGTSKEFSPKNYGLFLAKYFNNPELEKKIETIFANPLLYREALYPETIPVLKKLKENFLLGIYSEGTKEFQTAKINLTDLTDYLEKKLRFIYPDKTGHAKELIEKMDNLFFIDDNPLHIQDIASLPNSRPIWIKRGPKAAKAEKLNCPTILSLEELLSAINNSQTGQP